ncbi:polysaccharide lyase family 7 protein [Pseudomonas sp. SG-MS2]|uniref:Polysaccharide lyase family 7 protein n=1 Tax=Pseudomonas putida TaxID=303 RepID=A0A7Y7ZEV7_PSEPU|nr:MULTISPECIES: polysaccharide lyase family 7 protein [Pseudomonas]KAF1311580.1 polysaccharide lyase family 7 protein [Pseudomonas sp. SG-MS2]NWC83707.1 polysaccharide lyase family 7 protein [Pseudomonas putida]RRV45860.1 polysaccharide lyase family 7 protein [Pseudomonas sp. p106]
MAVNIDSLIITTPVPKSASNPVALEVTGAQALASLTHVVARQSDGSIRMTAPTKGASSKSTHRTRCEWKEAVYWSLGSAARHRNHQTMTLEKVNLARKVVIAQLHVKDNNSPPIKVFWNKGKITVGFRSDFNQATPVNSTVLAEVPLGTRFDVSIEVSESGACMVSASSNGRSGTTTALQLAPSWATQTLNFHGGVYNQVDYSDDTPAEDASVCVISVLELSHE